MSDKDWLLEKLKERNERDTRKMKIDEQAADLFLSLSEQMKADVRQYSSTLGAEPSSIGPADGIIFTFVLYQRNSRSRPEDELRRMTLRLLRDPARVRVEYCRECKLGAVEWPIVLVEDQASIEHGGKTVEVVTASEILLSPFLFPDLEE